MKKDNWDLYEVVRYIEDHRSWFIEDTVKSNGNFYMISKFDPLFLVLPFLRAAKKLEPLPQILKQQDLQPKTKLALKSLAELYMIVQGMKA